MSRRSTTGFGARYGASSYVAWIDLLRILSSSRDRSVHITLPEIASQSYTMRLRDGSEAETGRSPSISHPMRVLLFSLARSVNTKACMSWLMLFEAWRAIILMRGCWLPAVSQIGAATLGDSA